MSEALRALYAGDTERAEALLPPDEELSVLEAAAFGRTKRLAAILTEDPAHASGLSEGGFTPLHLAVFAGQAQAARLLIDRGADRGLRGSDGTRAVDYAATGEVRALLD